MSKEKETFGSYVRQRRIEKKISLRQVAHKIGVSATYISAIELGKFKPPSEEKIKEMAKLLSEHEDEMLARAHKISSDLKAIIKQHPIEIAEFLRAAKNIDKVAWKKLTKEIQSINQ